MMLATITIADVARLWGGFVAFCFGVTILLVTPGVGPWIRTTWARNVTDPKHARLAKTIAGQLQPVNDTLDELGERVGVIDERTKQLEPNGGHSLHDHITQLDSRVETLEAGQVELQKGQANARRQQAAFTKKVTPMIETVATLAGPPRRTAPLTKEKP